MKKRRFSAKINRLKTKMKKEKEKNKPKKEEKIIISWNAPEYLVHDKGKQWYLVAGIILLITVIISIFTDNVTLALALIVLAAVYYHTHRFHPPKDIEIKITEMGMKIGKMFFPYSHIQAFWIIRKNGLNTLNLRVAGKYFSEVIIQLNDQDPVPVREYLVGQIPEWEGKEESASDTLLRLLKL